MIAAVIGARRLLPSGLLPGPQALALLAGVIFGFYLCFKEIRRVSDDLEAVRAYTLDAVSVLEANHPGGIGADRAPSGPPTAKAPPPDPAGPGPASADGREELLLREFAAGPDEDFVHVRDPSLRRLLFDDDAQGTEGAEEENVSSRGDAAEGAPGGTPEGAPEATPGEEQEEEEEEELGAEGAPGTPPDLDSLGVAALREELAGLGASFPAASKKADLRRLLAEARAASP